jgi:urea transport system permease protein
LKATTRRKTNPKRNNSRVSGATGSEHLARLVAFFDEYSLEWKVSPVLAWLKAWLIVLGWGARRGLCAAALAIIALVLPWSAHALTIEQARAMASGETDARIAAINTALAESQAGTLEFLQALAADEVKLAGDRPVIVRNDKAFDVVSATAIAMPSALEDVVNNNRMRGEIDNAIAALSLLSSDARVRLQAVKALQGEPDEGKLPLIEKALAAESDAQIKAQLVMVRAAIMLGSSEVARRIEAARELASANEPSIKLLINERLKVETETSVKNALETSLQAINAKLVWGERLAAAFSGISLGSILLLVALGLAITYGLMGVINMAHGELMMIGAYATYVVQGLFRQYLPGAFDVYLLAAIPVAFASAALVGAAMERTVIRFLYGRPLETLLATWGISLVLMQAVRTIFGAQNVTVENPSWMSGSVQLMGSLALPWNRIIILGFALCVLLAMALLIGRTRLGLFVRSVTQNRSMASCMGVNTARVDTSAFALGSGVAGLAGCALSQIGNVGPDLGQSYIVDAFMVVVLGGVGQLAGTVYAAMGLGIVNKLIEGWAGAVLAKIAVLLIIVVFIQKRPQGLFALKGRSAEA